MLLQLYKESSRKKLLHLSTWQSQTLLILTHSRSLSGLCTSHLIFTACEEIDPSWGSLFLWLDREGYMVELGFFLVFFLVGQSSLAMFCLGCCWKGSCVIHAVWRWPLWSLRRSMFPGGPVWINSAERDNVFLSSITDPCLTETKKNEGKAGGESFPFIWS